jgi:hypothetical protein
MHQGQDPDEVVLFINRSKGSAWDKQVLSRKGSHCIQAGDIGSDGDVDLMGANWSGPYQPVELWENLSSANAWSGDDWDYRVPVHVNAAAFDRESRPVEVPLDLTRLLGGQIPRPAQHGSSRRLFPSGEGPVHEPVTGRRTGQSNDHIRVQRR